MADVFGYAQAAPYYRAAGWMQVIPLPEGRKTPPPTGFTGRSRKPVTDDQISLWSQWNPNGNTGIVIPEGVLVLDIDQAQGHQAKADGVRNMQELTHELGTLPATYSSTAHGQNSPARHLFYRAPKGVAWKGGAIEGVDILQPGHRYSVVWPSIHPSGEQYQWYQPNGQPAERIPHVNELPMLPAKWVEYLRKPEHSQQAANSSLGASMPMQTGVRDPRMCKAINTFLNKTLANPASKGSRHDTTLQAVWALVNFAQEGHRGALDAISQLKPRFIQEITPDRQGGEREALHEWNSLFNGAMDKISGIPMHADPCEQSKLDRLMPGELDNTRRNEATSQKKESYGQQTQTIANTANTANTATAAGDNPADTATKESDGSKETPSSWRFEDLTDLANGVELPPTPTVFHREDGQGMFYRGCVNDLHGEPGCGKSLLAQCAVAEELNLRNHVIYIDYEDNAKNVVKRLLLMGVKGEYIIQYLHYVRPSGKPSSPTSIDGWRQTLDYAGQATLSIIDGVTSCLAYAGLDSNNGDDIAAWYNTMPRLIAAKGPAVVLIDHVIKNKDNRGRYAGGSMQKLALIDGISYSVTMQRPVGKGVKGVIVISSGKDRISEIEEHCAVSWSSNGSHLREAARITIDSTDPNRMRVTIGIPNRMPHQDDGEPREPFRPTGLMERISRIIEDNGEVSFNQLAKELKDDGSGARKTTIKAAVGTLCEEGHLSKRSGANNAILYSARQAYRQIDDPKSDQYQDRLTRKESEELGGKEDEDDLGIDDF